MNFFLSIFQKYVPDKYRPLFLGTVVYGLALAVSKSFGVIITPLLTRVFSPDKYGAMDSIITMTALLPSFMSLNLEWALTRYYFDFTNREEQNRFVSTLINFVAILDLLVTLICVLFSQEISIFIFGSPSYENVIRFAVLGIGIQLIGYMLLWILRLQQRLKLFLVSIFITAFFNLIFIILFAYILKQGIISYFWALCLSNIIQLGYLFIVLFAEFRPTLIPSILSSSLKFSLPLVPSVVIIAFIGFFPRLLLNHYSELAQTGLFAVAIKVAILSLFIFSPFQMAWQTYSMAVKNREDADKIYSKITRYVVFVLCIIMQFVILFAPEIINIAAGSEYSQAVDILRLVIIGSFASYLYYFFQLSLLITEKSIWLLVSYLIALGSCIISGFILIPIYGGIGAGIAYSITFIIQSISVYFLAQRQRKYNFPVKRIYGAICTSLLLIFLLDLNDFNLIEKFIVFILLSICYFFLFIAESYTLFWGHNIHESSDIN